jgi:hypothetical protein
MSELLFKRDRHVFEAHTDFQGYEGMDKYRPSRGDVLVIDQTWQMPGDMPGWLSSVKVPLVGFEVGSARGCQPLAPGAASLRWTIKKRIRRRLPRPPKGSSKAEWEFYKANRGKVKTRGFLPDYTYHIGKKDRCGELPSADWWPCEVEPGEKVRLVTRINMAGGKVTTTYHTPRGEATMIHDNLNFGNLRLMDGNVRAWSNFWEKNGRYFPIRRLGATVSLERPEPDPEPTLRDKIEREFSYALESWTQTWGTQGASPLASDYAKAAAAHAAAVMAAIKEET